MADEAKKPKLSAAMGEVDYRKGAHDRIGEAYILLRSEAFGGCAYLAGRAAEGALRGVLWRADPEIQQRKKSLDTGTTFADC